jgi:hypothetical protein
MSHCYRLAIVIVIECPLSPSLSLPNLSYLKLGLPAFSHQKRLLLDFYSLFRSFLRPLLAWLWQRLINYVWNYKLSKAFVSLLVTAFVKLCMIFLPLFFHYFIMSGKGQLQASLSYGRNTVSARNIRDVIRDIFISTRPYNNCEINVTYGGSRVQCDIEVTRHCQHLQKERDIGDSRHNVARYSDRRHSTPLKKTSRTLLPTRWQYQSHV